MDSRTDEEIAALVQAGDQAVFGLLLERYEEKLMRYAKKFIPDQDDANDIVQEIFIKAYINIKSFDIKRKFSPWIYRIAHNEFLNAIKTLAQALKWGVVITEIKDSKVVMTKIQKDVKLS